MASGGPSVPGAGVVLVRATSDVSPNARKR
jgi:hypothetical protein